MEKISFVDKFNRTGFFLFCFFICTSLAPLNSHLPSNTNTNQLLRQENEFVSKSVRGTFVFSSLVNFARLGRRRNSPVSIDCPVSTDRRSSNPSTTINERFVANSMWSSTIIARSFVVVSRTITSSLTNIWRNVTNGFTTTNPIETRVERCGIENRQRMPAAVISICPASSPTNPQKSFNRSLRTRIRRSSTRRSNGISFGINRWWSKYSMLLIPLNFSDRNMKWKRARKVPNNVSKTFRPTPWTINGTDGWWALCKKSNRTMSFSSSSSSLDKEFVFN